MTGTFDIKEKRKKLSRGVDLGHHAAPCLRQVVVVVGRLSKKAMAGRGRHELTNNIKENLQLSDRSSEVDDPDPATTAVGESFQVILGM